jgi:hypothetical protein
MATRIVAIVLGSALLVIGAAPAAASASPTPECFAPEAWDRPGIERPHRLECWYAQSAVVSRGPAHGRLSGVAFDANAQHVTWRYRPDDGAPADDSFVLRVAGPGGSVDQPVQIHVTPRSQNTPPECRPASDAKRTDGSGPAVVQLQITCWDYENDTFVIDGGGPGEHLDGPRTVPGGDGGGVELPPWRYRTATARGEEQSTFWATDDLGARSAEAPLSVEVGPQVDRLPACAPNPGFADPGADFLPIYARPGATRRFGLVCSDADHDALTVRLGTAPARGTLTTFAPGALEDHAWGSERWVDGVYRPAGASGEPDPFTVVSAAHGHTTETRMAIADADGRFYSSLGCAAETARTTSGAPGLARIACVDDDGDRLRATLVRAPAHGVASPPLLTPAAYGWDDVTVAWTPAPGFVGLDRLTLRIDDGHGVQADVDVDLAVSAPPPAAPATPAPPASGHPSVGQAPAVAPADQARAALRTRRVVLVRTLGEARVWARRSELRRGLAPRAGRTALAVTCPLDCRLDARVRSAAGRARASRLARTAGRPGRAARVRLSRRAAGLLRSAGGVAFELSARMPAGRAGRGTVRLRKISS